MGTDTIRERPQAGAATGGSAFVESSPAKEKSAPLAKSKSPALFRFGASYIVGFFFGWVCRKSIKQALVLVGVATALTALAKHTGVIDLDWASLQSDTSQSLAWLHGEVGTIKHFLEGYLPSAGAACLGIFMGARHA